MLVKYLPYGIIGLLVIILIFSRSCNNTTIPVTSTIIEKHDTSFIPIHDTLAGKTIYFESKKDTAWKHDTLYTPSADYNELLVQYDELGDKYFRANIYKKKFSIKNYGYIIASDTIIANSLTGSSIIDSLQLPIITNTITKIIPTELTRQLYIGGNLYSAKTNPLSSAGLGLIYKTKTDQIYQFNVVYNGEINYGIGIYWKIKLRK